MSGDLWIAACWTGVSAACLALTAVWPEAAWGPVAGFVVAFALLTAAVIEGARVAGRDRLGRDEGWRIAILTGAALVASRFVPWPALAGWLAGGAWLVGGSRLGAAIGHAVESRTYVWPLVIVALGADVWSVTAPQGLTNTVVIEGEAPALAELIVLHLAVPGVGPSPILGVGDVLFSGLLLGAVDTLGLSMRRAVLGMAAGFGLCLVTLIALALPIPALPMIGVGTAVALGGAIKPRWSEVGLAVGLVVGVLVVARLL